MQQEKQSKRSKWNNRCHFGVFIVNFEYIWHVSSVFSWVWNCKCRMEYFIALKVHSQVKENFLANESPLKTWKMFFISP